MSIRIDCVQGSRQLVHITPGEKFGRLTFLENLPLRVGNRRMGMWLCDCGKKYIAPLSRTKAGYVRSCGCLTVDIGRWINTIHGRKHTLEYSSWVAMKRRCLCPEERSYERYGGKGIKVCERWLNFSNFYADMGPRPPHTTIDRIDWTKGYEPGNCRWATAKVQARNRPDFTFIKTPEGIKPLVDYAAEIGISRGAAHLRLKRGRLEGCERV